MQITQIRKQKRKLVDVVAATVNYIVHIHNGAMKKSTDVLEKEIS